MKKELGIYLHISFCKKKCYYCDFISYSDKLLYQEKYINALLSEIESQKDILKECNITTIYIGGGTPSIIDVKNIQVVMNKLDEILNFKNPNIQIDKSNLLDNNEKDLLNNKEKDLLNVENSNLIKEPIEITIEVNPGTVTKEKLEQYYNLGINRLSIGLQSTQDKLLKQIGRIHTYSEFLQTYNWAREIGFKNINIDLMIGLPNQSIEDIKETVENIIILNPEHISVYSLIVEQGTKIAELIDSGDLKLPDEDLERMEYSYVKNKLELAGFKQYEISNFAKENYYSKHNVNCWKQKEYIGFGISAHSYFENIRFSNTEDFNKYIDSGYSDFEKFNIKNLLKNINCSELEEETIIENQELSRAKIIKYIELESKGLKTIHEIQTTEEKQKEYMLLGLRMLEGVSISEFKQKFGENPIYLFRESLSKLVEEELIKIDLDNIFLTRKGLDLANLVWEEFV